ncbi:hypothetical protein OIU76_019247 [Salix suchowensis]|nr:hypothetical protein OIU76_019247 [Salix suchowensis]
MDYLLYMTPEEVFYKEVLLHECHIGEKGRFLELPEDVSALSIGRCHDARSLCDVSPFKHATSLKSYGMWECDEIECLVSMSESSTDVFESLESLYLKTLRNFRVFIKREGAALHSWQSNSTFSHLKKLTIGVIILVVGKAGSSIKRIAKTLRVLRDRRSRPLELSQQTKELKFVEKAQIK